MEKRSAADRVAGLSDNTKRWVGMVHKGRKSPKRAAAPVNSQKKKRKKDYVDCSDVLDAVGGLPVPVPEKPRNASAAERDRVFLEESG